MIHIGIKIKELRKKKDMTQEKLAEYLNVSSQAVSKWETGVASPDLSMIVPLARLLDVTTDELFGLVNDVDERQEELLEMWQETWNTGDIEKRYEISKTAVSEYPGNFDYLMWLADAEASFAIHNCIRYSDEQKEHFQNAVKYYERIIEDCPDVDVKNDAICGIVMTLPDIGRRDEAVSYAIQHPNSDELLKWCLSGEEWAKHRQNMIFRKMKDLIFELEFGHSDLTAIKAAETIIKTVVDDGNYLWFHDTLMHNYIWQAECLAMKKQYGEAIRVLKKSHHHAVEFEKMYEQGKVDELPYTCTILNKLSHNSNDVTWSGTSTLTEDFKEYLSWKGFDALRERDDFKSLFNL